LVGEGRAGEGRGGESGYKKQKGQVLQDGLKRLDLQPFCAPALGRG